MPDDFFDVIIVGYGPTSQLLALALGRQGRSVAVVERWEERYPLPRAVCIDHEVYRILAANGLADALPAITHEGGLYQWFNQDWRELLVLDWSQESVSGGAGVHFVHQPSLEEVMDEAVRAQPTVSLLLGCEATAVVQNGDAALLTISPTQTGKVRTIGARYLIGCDGANSSVRESIGGGQEDRGFEADWLVIDVRLKDGVSIADLNIPTSGQYCDPAQPTTIVPAGVRDGRQYRRWEFMRMPGETVEALEREERVWALLSPWAGPDQVDLIRHKVYNFRSLLAKQWRNGRLLIAGDAAHVMPPFLGQGMCSGMRDAWNLTWKLGLILDGRASDRLLNSYQQERSPHTSQMIEMSIYLGKIICTPDATVATARDQAFLDGTHPPFPDFPHLEQGLLARLPDGSVQPGAGEVAPHVRVKALGRTGRLDDVAGPGPLLFLAADVSDEAVSEASRNFLEWVAGTSLSLAAGSVDAIEDLDGRIAPFMAQRGWTAMLVRPDYYVFGGATSEYDVDALVQTYADTLAAAGLYAARPAAQARGLPAREVQDAK